MARDLPRPVIISLALIIVFVGQTKSEGGNVPRWQEFSYPPNNAVPGHRNYKLTGCFDNFQCDKTTNACNTIFQHNDGHVAIVDFHHDLSPVAELACNSSSIGPSAVDSFFVLVKMETTVSKNNTILSRNPLPDRQNGASIHCFSSDSNQYCENKCDSQGKVLRKCQVNCSTNKGPRKGLCKYQVNISTNKGLRMGLCKYQVNCSTNQVPVRPVLCMEGSLNLYQCETSLAASVTTLSAKQPTLTTPTVNTTSKPGSQPDKKALCACACGQRTKIDAVDETMKKKTAEKLAEKARKGLTVNKSLLSKTKAKKISAPDKRVSSQNVGYLAVGIMTVLFGLIVLSDLHKLGKCCQSRREKQKRKRTKRSLRQDAAEKGQRENNKTQGTDKRRIDSPHIKDEEATSTDMKKECDLLQGMRQECLKETDTSEPHRGKACCTTTGQKMNNTTRQMSMEDGQQDDFTLPTTGCQGHVLTDQTKTARGEAIEMDLAGKTTSDWVEETGTISHRFHTRDRRRFRKTVYHSEQ